MDRTKESGEEGEIHSGGGRQLPEHETRAYLRKVPKASPTWSHVLRFTASSSWSHAVPSDVVQENALKVAVSFAMRAATGLAVGARYCCWVSDGLVCRTETLQINNEQKALPDKGFN